MPGRSVGIGIGSGRRTRHMMCERYAREIESASALSDLVASSHGMVAGVFVVTRSQDISIPFYVIPWKVTVIIS